jgi:hypothetical protein
LVAPDTVATQNVESAAARRNSAPGVWESALFVVWESDAEHAAETTAIASHTPRRTI